MELSREQQIAFDKYIQGNNIFITGPGGTGKSELIRLINKHALNNFKDIYVTALTGCAAILLNCKAKTLHSWAGIGLGNGTIENIIGGTGKKQNCSENNTRSTPYLQYHQNYRERVQWSRQKRVWIFLFFEWFSETVNREKIFFISVCFFALCKPSELEFFKSLWGLGTEEE